MNGQIIELRPQTLKLERYCIIVFQGYERWSFCRGLGLGKLKGSCCTVLSLRPVSLKRNPVLRTPAWYRHAIITELLCPWGKKALTFSLNATRLIRAPRYYGHFLCPPIRINGVDCTWKRLVSFEDTARYVSYKWSLHRISFTCRKVRVIFQW